MYFYDHGKKDQFHSFGGLQSSNRRRGRGGYRPFDLFHGRLPRQYTGFGGFGNGDAGHGGDCPAPWDGLQGSRDFVSGPAGARSGRGLEVVGVVSGFLFRVPSGAPVGCFTGFSHPNGPCDAQHRRSRRGPHSGLLLWFSWFRLVLCVRRPRRAVIACCRANSSFRVPSGPTGAFAGFASQNAARNPARRALEGRYTVSTKS